MGKRAPVTHHIKSGLNKGAFCRDTASRSLTCLLIETGIPKLPCHWVGLLNEKISVCDISGIVPCPQSTDGNYDGKLTTQVFLPPSKPNFMQVLTECIFFPPNILSKSFSSIQKS